jgi:hypothetical protein
MGEKGHNGGKLPGLGTKGSIQTPRDSLGQFRFRIKPWYSYIRDHRIDIHLRIWVISGISLPGIYLVEHKFIMSIL